MTEPSAGAGLRPFLSVYLLESVLLVKYGFSLKCCFPHKKIIKKYQLFSQAQHEIETVEMEGRTKTSSYGRKSLTSCLSSMSSRNESACWSSFEVT